MLGVYQGNTTENYDRTPTEADQVDSLGNLREYQGSIENLVQLGDLSPIRDAKIKKQQEIIRQQKQVIATVENEAIEQVEAVRKVQENQPELQSVLTDELGNLRDYKGPVENLVQYGDLSPIRDAKIAKQRELLKAQQEIVPTIENEVVEQVEAVRKVQENRMQKPLDEMNQDRIEVKLMIPQLPDVKSMIPQLPDFKSMIPQLPDFKSMIPQLPDFKSINPIGIVGNLFKHKKNQADQAVKEVAKISEEVRPTLQTINTDELGNLQNYRGPIENLVQYGDLSPVRDAKIAKQREFLESQLEQLAATQAEQEKAMELSEPLQSVQSIKSSTTDELGNYKDYQGVADNLVQYGDLSPVREAKLEAQRQSIGIANTIPSDIGMAQSQAEEMTEAQSMVDNVEDENYEGAMPTAMEPPASEGNNFNIEYNAPAININGGGNIDDKILARIQSMLEEQKRSFATDVQRVIRDSAIKERRLSYA